MRHTYGTLWILSLVAAVLLAPAPAVAQVTTALLQGRVLDQSGAVVPRASVEAHNLNTGVRRSASSDQYGSYRILALPIGPYEIIAIADGFGREVRSGVILRVGQQATVDFTLTVAAAEAMTVTGEAPIIEITESAISTTITTRQIDQLPLPGRDFTELASLTPGVQASVTEDSTISASGGSGSSNTFLIDGVSGDAEALGGQRTALWPDVVAEFEVLSSQYSAEFGRASGAVINVVTRSGSNDIRGRVSAFYRDDSLTSDNPFVSSTERTPFDQQIYSVFLGGPLRRDKAFYFASYERADIGSTALVTVDPAILAALGQSTDRTLDSSSLRDRVLGKLDLNLTPMNLLGLRIDLDEFVKQNDFAGGTFTIETGVTTKFKEQNLVLSNTWIITPSVVNDLRLQYGVDKTDSLEVNCPGCPFIIRPSVITGKIANFPQSFEEKRLQLVEALNFEVREKGGDHSFKIGADLSRIELPLFVPQFFDGAFIFTTDAPFNADDPLTYPLLYLESTGDPTFTIDSNIYGLFAQDQWRIMPNLTLNLGIRWDYEDHAMIRDDTNNFAPRLHFAWDPFKDGRMLVRGGGGTYYDPIFLNAPLIGVFLAPDRFTQQTILFPGYPNPRVGGAQIPFPLPPTVSVLDTDAETPYINTFSLGLARELAKDLALSVDYVHADGENLLLLRDLNAPVAGERPDPAFAEKFSIQTLGRSEYRAFLLGLRKRFGGRYSMNAAYTLATNENSTDSHRGSVSDGNDIEADFGSSANDIRHTFNAAMNFSAPWGINVGLGGSYRSGAPYNIITGLDDNKDQNVNDRPLGVKRNSARGSDVSTVNLRLAKVIKVSQVDLELIAEGFNLFDTTNETDYQGDMQSAQFGQPTGVLTGAFGPRQIQFGVRLDF